MSKKLHVVEVEGKQVFAHRVSDEHLVSQYQEVIDYLFADAAVHVVVDEQVNMATGLLKQKLKPKAARALFSTTFGQHAHYGLATALAGAEQAHLKAAEQSPRIEPNMDDLLPPVFDAEAA